MTHSVLEGLNIVQPEESSSYDQQDLLNGPQFPDLAAQLDLWTNLTFQSDEPLVKGNGEPSSPVLSDDERDDEMEAEGTAALDGHTNVVNPTETGQQPQPPYDVNSILAGFGIDPFLVPQVNDPQPNQAMSLAQLLSAYPFAPPSVFGQQINQLPPLPQSAPSSANRATKDAPPPLKRSRTRKGSSAPTAVSSVSSPPERDESPLPDSPTDVTLKANGTPMTASEDKRRRNTAASARFRAKKKEREAALERRSKDLEMRVGELERECEALRRENGWLKGLVVGVTGAQAAVPSEKKRKRGSAEEKDAKPGEPVIAAA